MKQYVVDAFTNQVFKGNPAAVCIMDKWLDDETMLAITKENNLSETAFAVKNENKYQLRWFTPGGEINLCGHATLATAFVIMNFVDKDIKDITFTTLSGDLEVTKEKELYRMTFQAYELKSLDVSQEIIDTLGDTPEEVYIGRDLLCVFKDQEQVTNIQPDMDKVKQLDGLLLHVTAAGNDSDIDSISRSFGPKLNVVEDPVCGSGHCHIVPYWSKELNKEEIVAYQASERGGMLYTRYQGDNVTLAGEAVLFSKAEIFVG